MPAPEITYPTSAAILTYTSSAAVSDYPTGALIANYPTGALIASYVSAAKLGTVPPSLLGLVAHDLAKLAGMPPGEEAEQLAASIRAHLSQ